MMMSPHKNIILAIALSVLLFLPFIAEASSVTEYRIFSAELYSRDKKLARIALRRFRLNGIERYLAVNPETLHTEIIPVGAYLVLKKSFPNIRLENKNLRYFRAIEESEKNSKRLQNAGIIHIDDQLPRAYLTADLCPSRLQLDRLLFTALIDEYGAYNKNVPVALSVTGRWLEQHAKDLAWLLELQRKKKIAIVWINHSYSHRYNKKIPFWKNFFLDAHTRVKEEILKAEARMIESGLVPSVFFRFPGLVSNRDIFAQVTVCGLIPIGSDAWLGKNQWPSNGSIILVHANGQEPVGIKRFLWLLRSKKNDIIAKKWILYDLRAGLCEGKKNR